MLYPQQNNPENPEKKSTTGQGYWCLFLLDNVTFIFDRPGATDNITFIFDWPVPYQCPGQTIHCQCYILNKIKMKFQWWSRLSTPLI